MVDDVVYEVDCAMITEGAVSVSKFRHAPDIDYSITKLTSRLDTGANASAEEAADEIEDGAVQVNNVVNTFRLQSTSFDKKSYLSHLKGTFRSHHISIETKIGKAHV